MQGWDLELDQLIVGFKDVGFGFGFGVGLGFGVGFEVGFGSGLGVGLRLVVEKLNQD